MLAIIQVPRDRWDTVAQVIHAMGGQTLDAEGTEAPEAKKAAVRPTPAPTKGRAMRAHPKLGSRVRLLGRTQAGKPALFEVKGQLWASAYGLGEMLNITPEGVRHWANGSSKARMVHYVDSVGRHGCVTAWPATALLREARHRSYSVRRLGSPKKALELYRECVRS